MKNIQNYWKFNDCGQWSHGVARLCENSWYKKYMQRLVGESYCFSVSRVEWVSFLSLWCGLLEVSLCWGHRRLALIKEMLVCITCKCELIIVQLATALSSSSVHAVSEWVTGMISLMTKPCVWSHCAATDQWAAGERRTLQQCPGPRRSSCHGAASCFKHHQGGFIDSFHSHVELNCTTLYFRDLYLMWACACRRGLTANVCFRLNISIGLTVNNFTA